MHKVFKKKDLGSIEINFSYFFCVVINIFLNFICFIKREKKPQTEGSLSKGARKKTENSINQSYQCNVFKESHSVLFL